MTGKMVQQVTHERGGRNSRCTLFSSGEMASMVHIYIGDSSLVAQLRMLSGAPQWMDSLSGALDKMDS